MRVLVVEDHRKFAVTIAVGLRREGMAVDVVFDGQAALDHAGHESYDVIVLDRDLPKRHGDEVCRALVARGSAARVLMLTASETIEDRVDGLGIGSHWDDHVSPRRVRLSRSRAPRPRDNHRAGRIVNQEEAPRSHSDAK